MLILLADDDPVTLDGLQECVEREGFRVLKARGGQEAWELWQKHKPDLCCLDVMMPGLDGYEVCRRIRAQDSHTPILFLSAKNEEVDVVVGLQLGADDFVRKPFGRHELLARIRSALRRMHSPTQSRLHFQMKDLTVRPRELRADRVGQRIDLSPREVAILELLFERAGEAVSRNELLDRVWGVDYLPESRTVDQHIARLRKRIELNPDRPEIIETVRNAGYRYQPPPLPAEGYE